MGSDSSAHTPQFLTILHSIRTIRTTTNPYISMLVDKMSKGSRTRLFSWRTALFGRYHVLHVHWPELMFVRGSMMRTSLNSGLMLVLLARLWLTRTPLVRTLHNRDPHEIQSWSTGVLLRLIDKKTSLWIVLNDRDRSDDARTVVIPHPHYREWFAHIQPSGPVASRFGFFGHVRDYKNIESLIRAFSALPDPLATLEIAGSARNSGLVEVLGSMALDDNRVTIRFEHISDEELVALVTRAELIVLPYRDLTNSGALLLALSLNRPVLVPENMVTSRLSEEVGEPWVQRFSGQLQAEDLDQALQRVRQNRVQSPDLSRREWSEVVDLHLSGYARAVRVRP